MQDERFGAGTLSSPPFLIHTMNAIAKKLRRTPRLQHLVLLALAPGLLLSPNRVGANPQGPNVVAGNVNFQGLNSNRLDINNLSQKAIINWQTFSIAKGEVTRVNQGANAFTLNRVVSGNPTEIYGQLKAANGGVAVINPNGIVVGQGGTIDVAGMLTLSTLDIQDKDFLNGGSNRFKGSSAKGVENYGAISSETGDVVLLGNFLQNAGSVSAPRGVVAFGAGGDIVVDQAGGAKISVQAGGSGGAVGIDNSGEINAAAAELKAHGNVYALAIKNDGVVRASGYNFSGGRLTLSAGSAGRIVNTGTLQARTSEGAGGRVNISGGRVELNSGTVDASGEVGRAGGQVEVTGSEVVLAQGASVNVSGSTGGSARLIGTASVNIAGSVDSTSTIGAGGSIDTTAKSVTIGSTASLNATGATSGGSVRIGGGFQGNSKDIGNAQQTVVERGAVVIADGQEGNGGQVVVWADGGTLYEGDISAQALGAIGNGGFVEVSGKNSLSIDGNVDTRAANGANGTFLIDPVSVSISAVGGGGTMTDVALRNWVVANNVIIHTGGAGADTGNISVVSGAKVIYDSPNSLTFLAHGDILVDGDIKNIGSTDVNNRGNITLVAGWDGTLPNLPNSTGNSQVREDYVSSADFINPDGTPLTTPGRFGTWGKAGSRILFNEAGLEYVEVGSARGETNVFADVVQMRTGRANGRGTQIGYRRVADTRDTIAQGGFGGYFADPNTQIVDGDINVTAKTNLFMRPSDEFNGDDLGYIRAHTINMIGHGGIRRADDTLDNVTGSSGGFGYDAGVVVVDNGSNSGDITVYAGNALVMRGGRNDSPTMIGHGGHSEAAPNSGNFRVGLGIPIIGDLSGDIQVTAGFLDMEAGLYDDSPVQIGHGGLNIRGEFSGDIAVATTKGNIRASAAANLGDAGPINPTEGRWTNNRNRSYAMIGHGGVQAFHASALPARNNVSLLTQNGAALVNNTSAPGDGIQINPLTGLPYGHNGDISVTSFGKIQFTASGDDGFAKIGHGGSSSHGDHRGDINVVAQNGSIVFDRIAIQLDRNGTDRRNVGTGAFVQIGHGGRRSSGGSTGDIEVQATGNIEFYAGRSEAFAQIGHGGRNNDDTTTSVDAHRGPLRANGTHSGDISVISGGDIRFRSGFGTGSTAYSMIGHGGFLSHSDILQSHSLHDGTLVGGGASTILVDGNGDPVLDVNGRFQLVADETQQGHNGDILVSAAGDISFIAGQTEALPGQEAFGIEMNRNDNFTMIGHGGRSSYGDHWGNIQINSGGDITFEARGGWNAITYEGTNEGPYNMAGAAAASRGTPRYGIDEDNGLTGARNFAMIGNGGYDADHRIQSTFVKTDDTGANALGNLMEFAVINTDDIIKTRIPHGLANGDRITFQTMSRTDANLSLSNTVYYVRDVTASTFKVSTTLGGTAVDVTQTIVSNSRDYSGKLGEGIGTWGPSDIRIVAGGDVTVKAAQLETVGITPPTRAFLNKNASVSLGVTANTVFYTDVFGNPVNLSALVTQHAWVPDIVNRVAPNLGPVGGAGLGPNGETLGRNLTSTAFTYRLSSDATPANQNRIVYLPGAGFAGGEIVYFSGPAASSLGLNQNQAYQVANVRIDSNDFQIRPIAADGTLGAIVLIPNGASAGESLTVRQTWNGWKSPAPVVSASEGFAQIGNGGRITDYLGGNKLRSLSEGFGHRGNISITAGGGVTVKASDIDPAVQTGQSTAITRIAFDRSPLLGSNGQPLFDILVGPGAPNTAPPTAPNLPGFSTMVGTNFGTSGTDTRSQLNPNHRLSNYAMIGVGGYNSRGDHQGDITINAGSTSGGIGLLLQGGEGREDFAQIGAGGFESDGYDPLGGLNNDNSRLNDVGSRGNISVNVGGKIVVQGGGVNSKVVGRTGTTTNTTIAAPVAGSSNNEAGGLVQNVESRFSYAQIGNGGGANGGTSSGNISVTSSNGGLDVLAGNNTQSAYAQIGHGGYNTRGQAHSGDVYVRVKGDINVKGSLPFVDDGSFTAANPGFGFPETGPQAATPGGAIAVTGATNVLGQNTITLAAPVAGLYVGQPVFGTGIGGSVVITAISGLTITLSGATTAAVTSFTAGRNAHGGQIAHQLGNYAQIGHGGWDSDPQGGNLDLSASANNGGFTGAVSLISTSGGLNLQGGGDPSLTRNDDTYFRGLSAHIGHGGNFTDGSHAGDILVSVKRNLSILGGAGGRDSFTMIGHGGHQVDGNLSGEIQVIAGGSMIVNRGADTDTSAVGSTNRAGLEIFNNWVKIGHGDQRLRQRTDGVGTRNGDILISVGDTLNLGVTANRPYAAAAYTRASSDTVLIGHIDSKIAISDAFRSTSGDTYIAVGRNNPYTTGTGQIITTNQTVIMSAGEGLFGEARFYMPTANSNLIAEKTLINNVEYTRIPAPGSGRADEQNATEHTFVLGANGELTATYTPEGTYPFQGFGLYNVYYGGTAPVVPPVTPPVTPPVIPPAPPIDPGFDFGAFVFGETYDAFFRNEALFLYDGYEGLLVSMALSDALYDDSPTSTGGSMFEELLDGSLGERRDGEITTGSDIIEDEEDEEMERRKRRASQKVGRSGVSYYVFDPATNRYSSYRVFGVEQSRLGVTQ